MEDVTTHSLRTYRHRIFKVLWRGKSRDPRRIFTVEDQKVKGQGHAVYQEKIATS